MKIYGIDFTSSPSARKPITVAIGAASEARLEIETVFSLPTLADFKALLHSDDPWIAAIDFPFGQPRRFVENIGRPHSWHEYVQLVSRLSRDQFVTLMRDYQRERPRGDIRHFRDVDRLARSCSPMQLDFVPVAKMFYAGAPCLLDSPGRVYPFDSPDGSGRIVVEAYPALVARRCIGDRSYKTDDKKKQRAEHGDARHEIVNALNATSSGGSALRIYGMTVTLGTELSHRAIEDGTGDTLDAVMCAVQSAWAHSRRETDFGMNPRCDPLEVWIADPSVLP